MGVCKEWGYNGNKERVDLWVIKEEQGKKKKKKNSSSTILALRAAPDPGKARKSSRRGNPDNAYTPALGGPDKGFPTTRGHISASHFGNRAAREKPYFASVSPKP